MDAMAVVDTLEHMYTDEQWRSVSTDCLPDCPSVRPSAIICPERLKGNAFNSPSKNRAEIVVTFVTAVEGP